MFGKIFSSKRSVRLGVVTLFLCSFAVLSLFVYPERGARTSVYSEKTSAYSSWVLVAKCEKTADIKILMYHYVRDASEDKSGTTTSKLSIDRKDFSNQMQRLARMRNAWKIEIATMSDLERFENRGCHPSKHIIIPTSDDGWEDTYTDIFPVAKRFDVKFTLSVISSKVWTWSTHIAGFINENEIREMLESGLIEVQSHSVDHHDFSDLTESGAYHEICDSKKDLESRFSIKINTFIFPAGHTDAFALGALKKCGYRYALTTHEWDVSSINVQKESYSLPRIRLARGYDFRSSIRF